MGGVQGVVEGEEGWEVEGGGGLGEEEEFGEGRLERVLFEEVLEEGAHGGGGGGGGGVVGYYYWGVGEDVTDPNNALISLYVIYI